MHGIRKRPRRPLLQGFTLVELLVVIAIIGVLVSLLLPAVQAAREAARRTQCLNKIKQLALAVVGHEDSQKFMPSGGWGWKWVGDPDLGFGKSQPGGWTFSVLPYMEQGNVWSIGQGLDMYDPSARPQKRQLLADMNSRQLGDFICPSRRPSAPSGYKTHLAPFNAEKLDEGGKTDYAINAGAPETANDYPGPSYNQSRNPLFPWPEPTPDEPVDRHPWNGVYDIHSELRLAQISDGLSNTYLVGEKYLQPAAYEGVGSIGDPTYSTGDNEMVYTGFNRDHLRMTHPEHPPLQDRQGLVQVYSFGSAHPGIFNMSLCDGSARTVSFDIDPETHQWLGVRNDGQLTSQ